MAASLGMEHRTPLFRLFGLREILVGFGILAKPTSPALLWARVGGDALDLAALAAGLRRDNPKRRPPVVCAAPSPLVRERHRP